MTSTLIDKIYKSRKNVLDIMSNQEYDVSEYGEFSINEVNIMFNTTQLDMLLKRKDINDPKITNNLYICYHLYKILRPQNVDNIIEDLFITNNILEKKDTLFIIVKDDINDTLTNYLKQLWATEKILVVVVKMEELLFNILNHELVPPHRIMSKSETDSLKLRFGIKDNSEMPDISRFDPVAKVICMRPNDVCEIKRKSKTGITGLYYRVCLN